MARIAVRILFVGSAEIHILLLVRAAVENVGRLARRRDLIEPEIRQVTRVDHGVSELAFGELDRLIQDLEEFVGDADDARFAVGHLGMGDGHDVAGLVE